MTKSQIRLHPLFIVFHPVMSQILYDQSFLTFFKQHSRVGLFTLPLAEKSTISRLVANMVIGGPNLRSPLHFTGA